MKYLVFILALVFAYTVNAQTFNAEVSNTAAISGNVIAPLEGSAGETSALGDVIKGQVRMYEVPIPIAFTLIGEKNKTVEVTFTSPSPVENVSVIGGWYDGGAPYPNAIATPTKNYIMSSTGFVEDFAFLIYGIDATNPGATLGLKTFEFNVQFQYVGL